MSYHIEPLVTTEVDTIITSYLQTPYREATQLCSTGTGQN